MTTTRFYNLSIENGMATFRFDYDSRVRDAIFGADCKIKGVPLYNRDTRMWCVDVNRVPALLLDLAKIPGVECSQFQNVFLEYWNNRFSFNTPKKMSGVLYAHQKEAVVEMLQKDRLILGDSMGLGKTRSAIVTAYNIKGRKLVVCPGHLKLNWQKELLFAGIDESEITIVNSKGFDKSIESTSEWLILNYELLKKINDIFVWGKQFAVGLFDEAHYCKSVDSNGYPASERARLCLELSDALDRVYLLTGTPVPEKTKDLWNLLQMVRSPLAKSWSYFVNRYCDPYYNGFGINIDGASNGDELFSRLQRCMLRRCAEDVLDLPEKIRTKIPVSANLTQYRKFMTEFLGSKIFSRSNTFAALSDMKHSIALAKAAECKKVAADMIAEGNPVVIFTYYRDVVDYFMKNMNNIGCIVGGMSDIEKEEVITQFQSGGLNVVVCTYGAGSTGITLTRSSTIIFNDFDYSASNMRQAEDRIWRIGQQQKCNILYLYANGAIIDEMLIEILDRKIKNIGKIVDNVKSAGLVDDEAVQLQLADYLESLAKEKK